MKSRKLNVNFLVVLLIAMVGGGCGTQAGNPSKPSGSEIVMPEIKYSLPTNITGESTSLNLAGDMNEAAMNVTSEDTCTSLLHCKAKRTHMVVKGINAISSRISHIDGLRKAGVFRNAGPGKNLHGKLEAKEDGDFDYAATMCYGGSVFMHMQWSANSNHIVVTRDFSVNPLLDMQSRVGKSRVEYTSSGSTTVVDIMTQSEWDLPPDAPVDGNIVIEHVVSTIDANKSVEIKSVDDWYNTLPTSFDGDDYMTGRLNKNGVGEFVGYFKSAVNCSNGFDENATDLWNPTFGSDPRWCFGRRVDSATIYTQNQLKAALGRLEPVGVLSKHSLTDVSFPVDVSCE